MRRHSTSIDGEMSRRLDRRNLIMCLLLPLAAIACAWPIAEGGIHDDAAYVHMAKTLAATGRFAYNGWGAMTLGIQVWWAAAWIRLVGFSFTVTRLSLLPFAAGAVAFVYLLGRRARLSASDSLFTAALFGAQTDFLDLAPIFMSDVSSICMLFASLYAFARAIDAASGVDARPTAFGWLLLGMLSGMLGGTIRQNVWFVLITGPAVVALWPGIAPVFRTGAIASVIAGAACVVLGIRWFNAQPYAIPATLPAGAVASLHMVADGLPRLALVALVGCVLPVMTVLVYCLPSLELRTRPRWVLVASALLSGATCVWLQRRAMARVAEAVTDGSPARALVAAVCDVGTGTLDYLRWTALLLLLVMLSWDAWTHRRTLLAAARRVPPTIAVSIAYGLFYVLALLPYRSTSGDMWTRYFMLFTPILAWCILSWSASRGSGSMDSEPRRWAWAWLLVAFTGIYGVMVAHDHFAETRARLGAIDYLVAQGVPRTRIAGGWCLDHWEQIERAGFINNPRIRNPPSAYRPLPPDGYPNTGSLCHRELVRLIVPEYIIGGETPEFPGDGMRLPSFAYTAWLPRNQGTVTIRHQMASSPSAATGAGRTVFP
jgi:hypothetical protein